MGNRIKSRRKELRIKQSELAESLDISNNHISSIENGREKPSLDMFLKICDELKVTPDYLLLGNVHAKNVPQTLQKHYFYAVMKILNLHPSLLNF